MEAKEMSLDPETQKILDAEIDRAFKRIFNEALETAAQTADCGCFVRPTVLATAAEGGWRKDQRLCLYGDVCCALQAMEIRALKKKTP
jgi:hypothetical protein